MDLHEEDKENQDLENTAQEDFQQIEYDFKEGDNTQFALTKNLMVCFLEVKFFRN